MTTRIRLKASPQNSESTGVYADGKELPVGHIMTLPEGVTLETSGYAGRAELVDGEKTGDHVATTALEGDPNGGAEKPTPLGETEKEKIVAGDPVAVAGAAHADDVGERTVPTYTVVDTGSPGWKEIQDADGNTVKKVRPREADDFEAMDDAGKAKFLAD